MDVLLKLAYAGEFDVVLECVYVINDSNVNKTDDCGFTLLHWASFYGEEALVKILLDKRADLKLKTKHGWTAMYLAKDNDDEENECDKVVDLLKAHGVERRKELLNKWVRFMVSCAVLIGDFIPNMFKQGCGRPQRGVLIKDI